MRLSELLRCANPLVFEALDNDGEPNPYPYWSRGTFFFARYSGKYFGITARHCLNGENPNTIRLFVPDAPPGTHFVPLRRLHVAQDPPEGRFDWSDLALMELDETSLTAAQRNAPWFVDFDRLRRSPPPTLTLGALLLTRGCPTCIGEIDFESFKIRNAFFSGDGRYVGVGHEPTTGIFRFHDLSLIPSIDGMSGSPIFKVIQSEVTTQCWFVGVMQRGAQHTQDCRFLDYTVVLHALQLLN